MDTVKREEKGLLDVESADGAIKSNKPGELQLDEKIVGKEGLKQKKREDTLKWLKYISLMVLVLQNAGQVLIMRYAKTRNQPQFLNTVAVFYGEVMKLLAASILFALSTRSAEKMLRLLHKHFVTDFLDTIKVGIPAFVYTIQNFLLYLAIEHLDAGTYMVTYQIKILTSAMFTVLLLKRPQSIPQWISLVILVLGVAIVQLSARKTSSKNADPILTNNITMEIVSTPSFDGISANMTFTLPINDISANITSTSVINDVFINTTSTPLLIAQQQNISYVPQNPLFGFLCVIAACFLSGFAGIYFEKVLKGSKVSLWLRNIQLASLSIPISLVVILIKDYSSVSAKGFMQGFDTMVWCVVMMQALGGLLVAVVIKYADNILKGFATSIAIVISCIASIFIFALYPRELFVIGATLVIAAVVIYGVFPYKSKPPKIPSGDVPLQQSPNKKLPGENNVDIIINNNKN